MIFSAKKAEEEATPVEEETLAEEAIPAEAESPVEGATPAGESRAVPVVAEAARTTEEAQDVRIPHRGWAAIPSLEEDSAGVATSRQGAPTEDKDPPKEAATAKATTF
jgi:hypothetical protein